MKYEKGDISFEFGLNVRLAREKIVIGKKIMSQEKLAELAGLTPTYIGEVERGEKNVTLKAAEQIANALGVDLTVLIKYDKLGQENAE